MPLYRIEISKDIKRHKKILIIIEKIMTKNIIKKNLWKEYNNQFLKKTYLYDKKKIQIKISDVLKRRCEL